MFDGRNLQDAEHLVDDRQAAVEARGAQARALSARLSGLTATATSEDGLVTVTVGSTGGLVRLELAEGIRGRPADQTARQIMATLRSAKSRLTAAVAEAIAETVGADSPTGRAVISSYTERAGGAAE
nr:YbaB/EbfC family nucleoid-associated protein [uncultured Actinoplanes sp.]